MKLKRIWVGMLIALLCATAACSVVVETPAAEAPAFRETASVQAADTPRPAPDETVSETEPTPAVPAEESDGGVPEGWYDAAGTGVSAEQIEAFAKTVRESVVSGDWDAFAQTLYYPITVGETTYYDSAAFLASDPEGFFTDEWKAAVAAESCHLMFASWQGVMMGNGELWIGGVINDGTAPILVTAINP